jgi:hypothetical protein
LYDYIYLSPEIGTDYSNDHPEHGSAEGRGKTHQESGPGAVNDAG